jgi:hypothetical protein
MTHTGTVGRRIPRTARASAAFPAWASRWTMAIRAATKLGAAMAAPVPHALARFDRMLRLPPGWRDLLCACHSVR